LTEASSLAESVSKESKVEQNETSLSSVEVLLDIDRVRFFSTSHGIATGLNVRGTDWHLLALQASSKPKRNEWSATSKKVFLTTTAIAKVG